MIEWVWGWRLGTGRNRGDGLEAVTWLLAMLLLFESGQDQKHD